MAKITGSEEGGSKKESRERRDGISRKRDPMGTLVEVVRDLLALTEGLLQQGPSPARIDLRMARYRLYEAFPRLVPSDTDLAQALAQEDGEAIGD